jgi:hypothetical protein
MALVEPEGDHRLHHEATAERIEAEKCREPVDAALRLRQRRGGLVRFAPERLGKSAVDERGGGRRAPRRGRTSPASLRGW